MYEYLIENNILKENQKKMRKQKLRKSRKEAKKAVWFAFGVVYAIICISAMLGV